MEELGTILSKVHEITTKSAKPESIFADIAKELFSNYCIKQGNIEYRFLEIEFYYYSPKHQDLKEDGKTPFVYKRQCDNAGAFFLHNSGVDICFKNEKSEEQQYYGGILIRTLLRIEKTKEGNKYMVVCGPLDCCSALFNYTDSINFPKIDKLSESNEIIPKSAKRYNVKGNFKDKKYCFYHNEANQVDWCYKGEKLARYNPETKNINEIKYNAKPWVCNRQ